MASSRAIGNAREYRTVAFLRRCGYVANRTAKSGQRISASAKESGFACDIVALARTQSDNPNLVIEVGGRGKRVTAALQELEGMKLRDFICVVCRYLKPAGKKNSTANWYVRGQDGKALKTEHPGTLKFNRDAAFGISSR